MILSVCVPFSHHFLIDLWTRCDNKRSSSSKRRAWRSNRIFPSPSLSLSDVCGDYRSNFSRRLDSFCVSSPDRHWSMHPLASMWISSRDRGEKEHIAVVVLMSEDCSWRENQTLFLLFKSHSISSCARCFCHREKRSRMKNHRIIAKNSFSLHMNNSLGRNEKARWFCSVSRMIIEEFLLAWAIPFK